MDKKTSRNSYHKNAKQCKSTEMQESISISSSSVICKGFSNVNISTNCSSYAGNMCKNGVKIKCGNIKNRKGS